MIEVLVAAALLAAGVVVLTVDEVRIRRRTARRIRLQQASRVTVLAAEEHVAAAYRRIQSEARHPSNDYPLTDG